MATKFLFDNKEVSIPGAYAQMKSGIKNPAIDLAFGNALIIDTGSGAEFGGGSGIAGVNESGKEAVYKFDNVRDFRDFAGGGLWWLLSGPMFIPGGGAAAGISSLTYVRAAATVPASVTFTFVGAGSDGGSVTLKAKNEGLVGNGLIADITTATSTIEVTAAGATADKITLDYSGTIVAEYINASSDSIAEMVSGLVIDAKARALVSVVASDATTLVISAIAGQGTAANSITPTVTVTGAATGTATQYSGGVDGTNITRGFGATMKAGTIDIAKFTIEFTRGSFKGIDSAISDGTPYDDVTEVNAQPILLARTTEFDNMADLLAYLNSNQIIAQNFYVSASTITGDGSISAADLASYASIELFASGTETFSSTYLNQALADMTDEYFDFILLDDWGDDVTSTNNIAIQGWAQTELPVQPDLYAAAGYDSSERDQSITAASSYNSQSVTVVHGGAKKSKVSAVNGFKLYDSIYMAAALLGREAGLSPQIPMTFKSVGIEGEVDLLNEQDAELLLDAGILISRRVGSTFDIVKGINSLQTNDFLVNGDGTTHSKQLRRIVRQINKELIINTTNSLLKNPAGANRNTLDPTDVQAFVEGYLKNKVATSTADDLILSFGDIVVTINQDAYEVTYSITPNFEVSFVFFTGFLLDPNS